MIFEPELEAEEYQPGLYYFTDDNHEFEYLVMLPHKIEKADLMDYYLFMCEQTDINFEFTRYPIGTILSICIKILPYVIAGIKEDKIYDIDDDDEYNEYFPFLISPFIDCRAPLYMYNETWFKESVDIFSEKLVVFLINTMIRWIHAILDLSNANPLEEIQSSENLSLTEFPDVLKRMFSEYPGLLDAPHMLDEFRLFEQNHMSKHPIFLKHLQLLKSIQLSDKQHKADNLYELLYSAQKCLEFCYDCVENSWKCDEVFLQELSSDIDVLTKNYERMYIRTLYDHAKNTKKLNKINFDASKKDKHLIESFWKMHYLFVEVNGDPSESEEYKSPIRKMDNIPKYINCYLIERIEDLFYISLQEIFSINKIIKECAYCKFVFVPQKRKDQRYCKNISLDRGNTCLERATLENQIYSERTDLAKNKHKNISRMLKEKTGSESESLEEEIEIRQKEYDDFMIKSKEYRQNIKRCASDLQEEMINDYVKWMDNYWEEVKTNSKMRKRENKAIIKNKKRSAK